MGRISPEVYEELKAATTTGTRRKWRRGRKKHRGKENKGHAGTITLTLDQGKKLLLKKRFRKQIAPFLKENPKVMEALMETLNPSVAPAPAPAPATTPAPVTKPPAPATTTTAAAPPAEPKKKYEKKSSSSDVDKGNFFVSRWDCNSHLILL